MLTRRWLGMSAALALALTAVTAGARADDSRGLPVHELPPFPDVKEERQEVVEVSLYGAALAEEELVVGASKREQSLGTVASAVTVLSADHIRRFGYRTLADALRGVAGFYVVDDRMVERVGIRGVQLLGDANTRILVLVDGSPINEPWSQYVDGSHALPLHLDDVARIEVIRGPVSSIYGTNAFLGIINVVTFAADQASRAYARTSVDGQAGVGVNAGVGHGGVDRQVRGTLSYLGSPGETVTYRDLESAGLPGRTDADGIRALHGSLAVHYDRLFFQLRAYDRERELPGAPYDSVFGSNDNRNRDRQALAEVGYTHELSRRSRLVGRAWAQRFQSRSQLLFDRDPPARFRTEGNAFWYGAEARGLVDLWPRGRRHLLGLTAGATAEVSHTGSESSIAGDPASVVAVDRDLHIEGLYAEATSEPLPWFAVTAGVRFDRNSVFQERLPRFVGDGNASPRLALFLRRGEDYGLKYLYAEGFRNPSIFEAFYQDGERFSPAVDNQGDTFLFPERIRSHELVAHARPRAGLKLRLSAWQWRLRDLLKKGTVLDPDLLENRQQFGNQAALVSRGVEVEASYRDTAGWFAQASGALSFVGANCLASDGLFDNPFLDQREGNCDRAENVPRLVATAAVSSPRLADRVHLSTALAVVGPRRPRPPLDPREDRTLGTHVGWHLIAHAPDLRGFDVTVAARNLLGRERVPAQSDYNRSVPTGVEVLELPGPGRSVLVRVGYQFR